MEEVKNNIKTFVEILQIGKSESVVQWHESNFKRAQGWALYAEEVYKKLKNKSSLVQVISNFVKALQTSEQGTVGSQPLGFSDLQHATQTLRLVLLNNPHLSSAQFSHVLDLYHVDFNVQPSKDLRVLISDTYSISCNKGTFHTLANIKDELSHEKSKESCKTIETICLDTYAKLLWRTIVKFVGTGKDMEGSYDDVIKKVESLVFCSEKGMEVLLRMLVLEMKGELSLNTSIADQARIDRAKHLIYHWVLDCSKNKEAENYRKVWSCPFGLLCELSWMSMVFCENHVSFLYSYGDNLLGIGCDETTAGDQLSIDARYRYIVGSIELLLQGPGSVSKLCKEKLKLWSTHSTEIKVPNSYPDIPTNNHMLRENMWKKIYNETCK